jgi:Cu-Zn family superoxide dismutase
MRRTALSVAGLALVAGACALIPASPAPAAPAAPVAPALGLWASTKVYMVDGQEAGDVWFTGNNRSTRVTISLELPPGRTALGAFHGVHIHANNDPSNGSGCTADAGAAPSTWFASADGHLVTDARTHGVHAGDLPPLLVNGDGTAWAMFDSDRFVLDELRNAAFIVHAQSDNLNNIPLGSGSDQYTANSPAAIDKTAKTGNGGDRIACGVINVFP